VAVADPEPSLVVRLFAEHRGALVGFFHRRIRSKADAQDLAQEVYLRMLRVSDQAIRDQYQGTSCAWCSGNRGGGKHICRYQQSAI
jgi:DNA-directed RNA polymerase specialized sigma24 family protein